MGMDRAQCPTCGYLVGLGTFDEPGECPKCETALMLTCEFRALTREDLLAEARRRARELSPSAR
jgi:predicted Zn-ribbon and HTH transcriptional regulator